MPYQYRPDLLPFALPGTIGLPYHGTVKNGQLTLPNSQTIVYAQPSGGDTTLVVSPLAGALTRTTEEQAVDTASGHQWLTHAFLSGSSANLGGVNLVTDGRQIAWLYCHATGTWLIHLNYSADGKDYQVTARRFGILSDQYSSTLAEEIGIGSGSFVVKNFDDDVISGGDLLVCGITHSNNGAITIFNLKSLDATFGPTFAYCGAMRVTIELVGGVPAATVSTEASGSDLYEETEWARIPGNWSRIRFPVFGGIPEFAGFTFANADSYETNYWTCTSSSRLGSSWQNIWSLTPDYSLSVSYADNNAVEINIIFFVLPGGLVKNVSSNYHLGNRSTGITTTSGDMSGETKHEKYQDCAPPYAYHETGAKQWFPHGESVSTSSTGCDWTFGINGGEVIDAASNKGSANTQTGTYLINSHHYTAPGIEGYPEGSANTSYFFTEEGGDTAPGENPASSVVIQEHNNNIYDFYRIYDYTPVYFCSLTISGIKFDRQGKNAVWNPLTNAVVLGDSVGQTINIV